MQLSSMCRILQLLPNGYVKDIEIMDIATGERLLRITASIGVAFLSEEALFIYTPYPFQPTAVMLLPLI